MTFALTCLSCARTQRRIAAEYRQWAREDEKAGNLGRSQMWAALAADLRRRAKRSLRHARQNWNPA